MRWVALSAVVAALVSISSFGFATVFQVQPGVFDPDGTGIVTAQWIGRQGLPDDVGKANQALFLEKAGPTSVNASAFAVIGGVEGLTLTELGMTAIAAQGHPDSTSRCQTAGTSSLAASTGNLRNCRPRPTGRESGGKMVKGRFSLRAITSGRDLCLVWWSRASPSSSMRDLDLRCSTISISTVHGSANLRSVRLR